MININHFPFVRMRRLRRTPWMRRLVAEVQLTPGDLIWPVFVVEGQCVNEPIASMPGVFRQSIDKLLQEISIIKKLGIPAIALFPVINPSLKTVDCREAWNPNNLLCRAVKTIKDTYPEIGVICDVALDPFNSLGHDGLVINGEIINDKTVEALSRQAVVQAQAGCDIVAPSDMMDGRIKAIRSALDNAGFTHVLILSYAAKYASSFYGPFRDALDSSKSLTGDKKTYQMDPTNTNEALREVALDLAEGADIIMVKPGLPYLDILHRVKTTFTVPTFVYQVSGEYAMLKAASAHGWLDNNSILIETLTGFRRAGADAILTYAAIEVANLLVSF